MTCFLLIVVKPVCEFTVPMYPDQPVRIPNFLEIHNLFHQNEYDRIICSTEGIMGLMSLYLKNAYTVPASFYIHTDWVMFSRKVLNFNKHNQNRIRRFLRTYYGAFDKIFVLNTDQQKWLTGLHMNFAKEKVCLTAHWADEIFKPVKVDKESVFGIANNQPVMMYVGRVSREKGVLELPEIYNAVKKVHPDINLVVVGQGPDYEKLQKQLPTGKYFNWVQHNKLPEMYSAADILVFPSKFDTFSCVVLESLSCGLPVVAYETKGPKDIIEDEKCGYLVKTEEKLITRLIEFFNDEKLQKSFRKSAVERAKKYNIDDIMDRFINDIGL
jgi:glycosyltransferase involved in cell wall biosynthesis